jgi:hypothetical protein
MRRQRRAARGECFPRIRSSGLRSAHDPVRRKAQARVCPAGSSPDARWRATGQLTPTRSALAASAAKQPRANVEVDLWFRPVRAPTLGRGAPRLDPSVCRKAASTQCSVWRRMGSGPTRGLGPLLAESEAARRRAEFAICLRRARRRPRRFGSASTLDIRRAQLSRCRQSATSLCGRPTVKTIAARPGALRVLLGDSSSAGLVALSMIGTALGARSAPGADYCFDQRVSQESASA